MKGKGHKDELKYLTKAREEFEKRLDSHLENKAVSLDNFLLKRTLGIGSFGRVILVQHDQTATYMAMKILEKIRVIKTKQLEHVLTEKKVLHCLDHSFIVKLHHSFKDNANLFMVLEFVSGGELFTLLRNAGKFSEVDARFYATQVFLAFKYLHFLDIAYRDLKPENLLLDHLGYVKLTDFGFAKRFHGRTWTLCGTPEYLAPEIILNKGYNKAVDWWSFGILIYEMVAGFPPFYANSPIQIYELIVTCQVSYPSQFSSELKDLLRHMIVSDTTSRYGNMKSGPEDIQSHKWFAHVEWQKISDCAVTAPYIPNVNGPGDMSNYDMYDDVAITKSPIELYQREFVDF